MEKRIEEMKASEGAFEISEDEIIEVFKNIREDVNHADPKIRKRVVQTLFQEARIYPKEGSPWERLLEIKGVQVPLTRVKMASPRGRVRYHRCSISMILSHKGLLSLNKSAFPPVSCAAR